MTRKTPAKTGKKSAPKMPKALKPEILAPEEDTEESPQEPDLDQEIEGELMEKGEDSQGHALALPEVDPDLRAISPSDPLRRYLQELQRYPLIDPEEEIRLAAQMRDGQDLEKAKDAAMRLVQANLRLVVKIAFEYRSVYSNVLDLIQEGNVGLMKAVAKFDPTKGARLSYYSSWWIRSYILKYLLDNFRLVKIGTTQAQKKLFYHLMREKERLEAQGFFAGPKLLAEKLDVKEKEVVEMQNRLTGAGAEMPLDAPMDSSGDSHTTFKDALIDGAESAGDRLEHGELVQLLRERLPAFRKLLQGKELKVFDERLMSEEPKTLQEVADLYGLTRERVRQIESKVIAKLKDFLREDLGLE